MNRDDLDRVSIKIALSSGCINFKPNLTNAYTLYGYDEVTDKTSLKIVVYLPKRIPWESSTSMKGSLITEQEMLDKIETSLDVRLKELGRVNPI